MICKIYNLALFIMKRQFPAGDFVSPVLTELFTLGQGGVGGPVAVSQDMSNQEFIYIFI